MGRNPVEAKACNAALDLTDDEKAWIDFLRLIGDGKVPKLTLRRVQVFTRICGR